MSKGYNEILGNIKKGNIKAIKLHSGEDRLLVDVLTSDGNLYTGLPYDARGIDILFSVITADTVIYDERVAKTFDSLSKETKSSNKKMYKQFEELCKQNNIDFEQIKSVLDCGQNKNETTQQLGRFIHNENPREVKLEFSGTPEQVKEQMEKAINEHPELKDSFGYPFVFPLFTF